MGYLWVKLEKTDRKFLRETRFVNTEKTQAEKPEKEVRRVSSSKPELKVHLFGHGRSVHTYLSDSLRFDFYLKCWHHFKSDCKKFLKE